MEIRFKLKACDACKVAGNARAAADGTEYSVVDLQQKRVPLSEDGCECKLQPVGGCHFCQREADKMPLVDAQHHIRLASPAGGVSICASCTILLYETFAGMAQSGVIAQMIALTQPKVVPGKIGLVGPDGQIIKGRTN